MKFRNVAIEAIAHFLPEEVWSSTFIEEKLAPLYKRLQLPFGRLELMTGIKERRFFPNQFKPSEASAKAGLKLFEKSQFKTKDIDLLVHAGVCRDHLEPCTAAYVHHLLQLPQKTQILDISNACLGVLNAIVLAGGMIEAGLIKTAMIVAGENGRPLIEKTIQSLLQPHITRQSLKPYFANLTIGSGAVALTLTHTSMVLKKCFKVLGGIVETDSSATHLCEGNTADEGLEMQTDSEGLLSSGIGVAMRAWTRFKRLSKWKEDTADTIICHQVGKRHQAQLYEKLKLDLTKDFSTFSFLGNMGSVSLPITLNMALENNTLSPNDNIALMGIGSGLSSLIMGLEYR
jgi:3-oxoacyl-[acyl-carrier-protein] synthase III